ncbi:hypothetical protein [Paenibacillus hamazuiensis]|uniref:hypothetical protein n=1 Tax=Paenibacillus hamazuiensis TaxID=2936508 RepID=UPI00200D75A0|nr:hypothetical protein [Paenibacillus hamazuiensis]
MKKPRRYPFVKNRYFYGKLLTVRDFQLEQTYVGDKRGLMNKLLHGSGIVTGLEVSRVDDNYIAVQPGLAIDSHGNEIVLPSTVKQQLSMVEGFPASDYAQNVYLCIEYREEDNEPVHSVASSATRSEEVQEFNRIKETYKLVIRTDAPAPADPNYAGLLEHVGELYADSRVKVWIKIPKYVNAGDYFDVTVHIDKALGTEKVKLSFELISDQFELAGGNGGSLIVYEEPDGLRETYAAKTYRFKTSGGLGAGTFRIPEESAKLTVGDKTNVLNTACMESMPIEIIGEPVKDRIVADYYNRTLDAAYEAGSHTDGCIYLAKICLIQVKVDMSTTYSIQKVEPIPFRGQVVNPTFLGKLSEALPAAAAAAPLSVHSALSEGDYDSKPKLDVDYSSDTNKLDVNLVLPKTRPAAEDIRMGIIELELSSNSLNPFSRPEKVSEEIPHGLGPGPVFIEVGIEAYNSGTFSEMLNSSERIYYGNIDVFGGGPYECEWPRVSIGTIVYPKKGTFRIGVRLNQSAEAGAVRLRWWAFKKREDAASELYASEAAASSDSGSGGT